MKVDSIKPRLYIKMDNVIQLPESEAILTSSMLADGTGARLKKIFSGKLCLSYLILK